MSDDLPIGFALAVMELQKRFGFDQMVVVAREALDLKSHLIAYGPLGHVLRDECHEMVQNGILNEESYICADCGTNILEDTAHVRPSFRNPMEEVGEIVESLDKALRENPPEPPPLPGPGTMRSARRRKRRHA